MNIIPTKIDIIDYITKKNVFHVEFGLKQNKPMTVFIRGKYIICRYYIGQSSGFGAFSKDYMPQGAGVIRTDSYSERKYYINDIIVEMLSIASSSS